MMPLPGRPRLLAVLLSLGFGCAPEPRGIIVVSLDTLRADRLGAYGSDASLTPNLDRFAGEAVIFDRAFAQSNETVYSHASLFTGRMPSRLAPLDGDFRLPKGAATVAATLQNDGWDTAAVVAGGHLSRGFGLDRGFDIYDDGSSWGSLRETGALALRWLDTRVGDDPFFLFVHGYDAHDRYLKPSPFGYAFADPKEQGLGAQLGRQAGGTTHVAGAVHVDDVGVIETLSLTAPRFEGGRRLAQLVPDATPISAADVAHLTALYDGSVAWVDACFGLFMAGLDEQRLLDHVTIVVLSDHGELLGETGQFGHRGSLDDAVTRVPLMVRPPGGAPRRRVTDLVALVDVAPTILALAEVPKALYGDGYSLVPALGGGRPQARTAVVSEGALRLLSARGETGRLTAEGAGVRNPWLRALLGVTPIDGVSLRSVGDGDPEPLRAALLSHLAGT